MGCATSAPHDDDNDAAAREFATVSGATPHGAPPRPHPADVETPARRRRRLRSERPSANTVSTSPPTAAQFPGLKRLPAAAATAVASSDDRPSTDSRREPSVAGNSNTSRHQAADGPPSSGELVSAESSSDAHQMPPSLRPEHDAPRGSSMAQAAARPRAPATTTTAVRPASEPADARSSSLNPLSTNSNLVTLPNHTANTNNDDSGSQPPRMPPGTRTGSITRRSASSSTIQIGSRNPPHLRRFPPHATERTPATPLHQQQQQQVPRQGGATSDIRQTSSGRSFMLASGFFSPRSASLN